MRIKANLKLVMVVSAVAMLVTPMFAQAAVTKAQLDAMLETEKGLLQQRRNGVRLTPQDQAAAVQQCMEIGNEYYRISSDRYSTIWSDGTLSCSIGTTNISRPAASDWKQPNRDYSTTYDLGAQVYMQGLRDGNLKNKNGVVVTEIDTQFFNQAVTSTANQKSDGPTWVSQLLNWIVSALGNTLASLLAGLATLALYILSVCTDYTTTTLAPDIINRGWVIIRDFMNLFFIVALIAMALATILQREAYSYRRLLGQLILMAILINFSKVIAETLINFSDMLISLFSPANGVKSYGGVIYRGFVTNGDGLAGYFGQGEGVVAGLAGVVGKVGGLLVLTVTLAAISLLMFVRMVGLWFLVMISPVAYALNILPGTQQYARQWWGTFTKYLIWGPVAMFFLRLSFVFLNEQGSNLIDDHFLNYLFISAFIWAGFVAAKGSGMYGSAAIMSGAQNILNKAKNYAKDGAKFTGKAAGNYIWRGNASGHLARVTEYGHQRLVLGNSKEDATKAAEKAQKEAKEWVGSRTAAIVNEPGLLKQRFSDIPNAERKKYVEKERRRAVIRRDYLKDFDEETAKKITAADFAYMVEKFPEKLNEEKLNNLMEHGSTNTKLAIAAAYSRGLINHENEGPTGKRSKLTPEQKEELRDKIRKFSWKQAGRKEADLDLPQNQGFMADDASMRRDVILNPKKSGFNPDELNANGELKNSFEDTVKNTYIKIKKVPRQQAQGGQNQDRGRNQRNQGTGSGGTGATGGLNPPRNVGFTSSTPPATPPGTPPTPGPGPGPTTP